MKMGYNNNYFLSKAPPLWSISNFTSTVKDNCCIHLYSFLSFKVPGTLINLTTCYCQVEHIHLFFQSVYSSISLSFHPFRPYFITFKKTCLPVFILLVFQQLKLNLRSFILSCQAFFNMPSHFPIHKLSGLLLLYSVLCTVKCYDRLNHFCSDVFTQYMCIFRACYTVQSRVQCSALDSKGAAKCRRQLCGCATGGDAWCRAV